MFTHQQEKYNGAKQEKIPNKQENKIKTKGN